MNEFQENLPGSAARIRSEGHIESVREQGGIFVEAVRLTRMPMLVTDATLPGNPITFSNKAFSKLSGYSFEELLGQDPHFMNGKETDPETIQRYEKAIREGRDETLEIVQYRKDGTPFRAMLFASPLTDGQGTVTHHFLSYLDITRRHEAEEKLRQLTVELEERVAARTRELGDANERLTKLVAEREMLVVEVNHRAKNSLAIASALLGIQARRQSDPQVKALFAEAQDRLQAMAQVHDLLSKSESSQWVEIGGYVKNLCEALQSLTDGEGRIRLQADVETGMLVHADIAVPLGLILTELITNAVKYAFPKPRAGTILAEARRSRAGWIAVAIRDNGIGMSAVRDGSLGYGLVRSLVKQIGGEIDIRSENGLAVEISFPDSRDSASGTIPGDKARSR